MCLCTSRNQMENLLIVLHFLLFVNNSHLLILGWIHTLTIKKISLMVLLILFVWLDFLNWVKRITCFFVFFTKMVSLLISCTITYCDTIHGLTSSWVCSLHKSVCLLRKLSGTRTNSHPNLGVVMETDFTRNSHHCSKSFPFCYGAKQPQFDHTTKLFHVEEVWWIKQKQEALLLTCSSVPPGGGHQIWQLRNPNGIRQTESSGWKRDEIRRQKKNMGQKEVREKQLRQKESSI